MSDQKTYGSYVDNKPLVSFVLVAYNQSRFIREAVGAAFAQDYSPLEIILSDDCSVDDTFAQMEEYAKSYSGPHKLILNRNERNLGIGGHVKRVSELAHGEILVMAAGDDVSLPQRTRAIVDVFSSNNKTFAVFSDLAQIDEKGVLVNKKVACWYKRRAVTRTDLTLNGGGVSAGATYSYRKECFSWPWPYPSFVICEDRLLPYRASLLGQVVYIDKVLVNYRLSVQGVSRALPPRLLLVTLNERHLCEIVDTTEYACSAGVVSEREKKYLIRRINELKISSALIYSLNSKNNVFCHVISVLIYNILHRRTIWARIRNKFCRLLENS